MLRGRIQKKIRRGSLIWATEGADIEMPKAPKGWVLGRGCPPPRPTRKSVGVSWAPSAESMAKPRPQSPFQQFLNVTERFRWIENAIFMLNMVTVLTTGTAEICWNSVDSITPILNATLVCCCWCKTVKIVFVYHMLMLVNKINLVCFLCVI